MRYICLLAYFIMCFVACMRPEPVPFSTGLLNFEITSILYQKSSSKFTFDLVVDVNKSYGPKENDAISWTLVVSDEKTRESILRDSSKFIGTFYQHTYTFPSERYPITNSEPNNSVLISFNLFQHGKEIRSDTLRAFLFFDSNQYLDSNFLKLIGNYTEDSSPLFYYETCQVHGNSFYYDYRIYDSAVNRGEAHNGGYFAAMKVSNSDSTYISRNWYVGLKRTFADTGEVPHDYWYSGDQSFKGDAPLFEMWVIYGKKYQYLKSICN